jgi:hypothetical protein
VKLEKNAAEESVEELCKRTVAEQDLEELLKLLTKMQQLIEARQSQKKPAGGTTGRGGQV